MGSSPSSMHRHLYCCRAGIVALVAMVSPLLMRRHLCSPCVFAVIRIKLLPLLRWRCCHCQAGVVALVTMASSALLMHRHLCHCHNDVVALVGLAPLPTLHGNCCPCCASVIVLIELTFLPSRCMGVVTVFAPVLLPPSSWRFCVVALVLSPLSCWCLHPLCTGISSHVAQASLPLLYLCRVVDLQESLPLLSWHVLSRGQRGRPHRRQRQHQRNKGNYASTTRVSMTAQ